MPLRAGGYVKMENEPTFTRDSLNCRFQAHWYNLIAPMCAKQSILDVGSGTGYGLAILGAYESHAYGIDIADCSPPVVKMCIEQVPDNSWHWVCAMDVIEHVEDDKGFLKNLLRVAINNVFFSTPNWNKFRAGNKYHVREYTPEELLDLLAGLSYKLYVSDISCQIVEMPVLYPEENAANFGVLITKVKT